MPSANFKDITGVKFGRLTAVECVGKNNANRALWRCVCECGNTVVVSGKALRDGNTKSCGCLNVESATRRIVAFNTTHGKTNTRLFGVWRSMIERCEYKQSVSYARYGAVGISVCPAWRNDFGTFYEWAMSCGYDPNAKRGDYTVDRIDNTLGYSPENCRLATAKEQARNRSDTRIITHNGIQMCASDWASYYGRSRSRFSGMSDAQIASTLDAYDRYLSEHGVNILPKRVNL